MTRLHAMVYRAVGAGSVLLIGAAALVTSAVAQESRPSAALHREVASLRLLVTEQADRIRELEEALQRMAELAEGYRPCRATSLTTATELATGWRSEAAWDRLSTGMSESDVIAILGRPSRVESGATHRTLHYEGEIEGAGQVGGSVGIVDEDWVQATRRPAFRGDEPSA